MATMQEMVKVLEAQGLKIQFSVDIQGDRYYVEGPDGTGYILRTQHMKHLAEEGKLTLNGIKELDAKVKALNDNAFIKR
jgi:hypothetical protein